MKRLTAAWSHLAGEQRLAAVAALATLVSTVLPWYSITVPERAARTTVTAFGVYSFVEAAIFLVAIAVLALLFARGERRAFHLPGGDGSVITAAGAWVVFLVFYRQFDKPDVTNAVVGVEWGIFVTILAGAGLALAGLRLRAAQVPEPPAPPAARRRRRPRSGTSMPGDVPRPSDPPDFEPPTREAPTDVVPRDPGAAPEHRRGGEPEQLSFEDPPRDRRPPDAP